MPGRARAIFDKFAFFLPPNNKNIGYPIAGPDNELGRVTGATTGSGTDRCPALGCTTCWWTKRAFTTRFRSRLRRSAQDLIDELRQRATEFLPPPFSDILAGINRPSSRRSTTTSRRRWCTAASR